MLFESIPHYKKKKSRHLDGWRGLLRVGLGPFLRRPPGRQMFRLEKNTNCGDSPGDLENQSEFGEPSFTLDTAGSLNFVQSTLILP
jgi:hypothetical protein